MWPDTRRQPLYAVLVVVLILGAIAWEVAAVAGKMKQYRTIGESSPAARQITVTGSGKARGAPDIALVSAGFTVEGADVRVTQTEANRRMAALVAALKGTGVAAEDLKTSEFSVFPRRTYEEGKPSRITGYEARQSVEVRIRDLDRINAVFAAAGGAGATNISGLRFTIDDPERLRAEARREAIAEAREKARVIAEQLDVRLGRPVAFQESGGGIPPALARGLALEAGIGGGEEPTIETGSTEVTANVSVTYVIE